MRLTDPAWLVAAFPDALVCRSSAREIRIGVSLTPERGEALVGLLTDGVEPRSLAALLDSSEPEAGRLLDELARHQVLVQAAPDRRFPDGARLVDAIVDSQTRDATFPLVWTGTEALRVPSAIDARTFRRVLRAFIAGMHDDTRLEAYCRVAATGRRTVGGDFPSPARLESALAQANGAGDDVAVIPLDPGRRASSISLGALGRAGEVLCHRLAPVLDLVPEPGPQPRPGRGFTWGALYALPSLLNPNPAADRWAHGSGRSSDHARLVARAEALERYATGDPSEHVVIRVRAAELDGAVSPALQHRLSPRQYAEHPEWAPYEPGESYLWTPALPAGTRAQSAAGDGRRWVLAETVFFPFHDPERSTRTAYACSSGVAAHHDRAQAAETAVRELIERDAFMWTWVQRVSRERIRPESLPAEIQGAVGEIESEGLEVALVNLTLELEVVILCVAHGPDAIHLGASCHADPARAAAKAVDEAAMTLDTKAGEGLEPHDVDGPLDHHRFYQQADRVSQAAFLFASSETIDLERISAFEDSLHERLARVGEPLLVDLSSSRTQPLRVVRAIVPGLIPISFGWDTEPLGLARLRQPRKLGGRILGRSLPPAGGPPILPHPFA